MARTDEIFQASFPDILVDYKKGASLAELADEYGVSAPTISKWLEDSGEKIKRRKWGQKGVIFETHFRDIAEMYEAGAEKKDIAAQFGVSGTTIRNWLFKGGYVRKKRGRPPLSMKARAHDLQARGWSPEAIAELFKEKPEDIYLWLSQPSPQLKPLFQNPGTKPKKKVRKKRRRRKKNPTIPKPPKHKCKHKWTANEKQYVFEMMQEGSSVKEIYDQTGASRARQNMIWRELGGFGRPSRPPKPGKPARVGPPPMPQAPPLPEPPPMTVTQIGPGELPEVPAPRRLGPGRRR